MPCFKISGVSAKTFRPMFSRSDEALGAAGMTRCIADAKPGYPCRVSMVDAEIGDTLILGAYEHHAVNGPFRASGPIYVREAAASAHTSVDEVPELLRGRTVSVRAYDKRGLMSDADVARGAELEALIRRLFDSQKVEYLHVHNASRGCFLCRIDRADGCVPDPTPPGGR